MIDRLLEHLAGLVACDTQNPPREIDREHSIFRYLRSVLPEDFVVTETDYGIGRVNFLAVRGEPRILFNVHLDTVPNGEGWQYEPQAATVVGDRVYGRGTCDIKGAAAALLTIAESSSAPMALLFSTDEEGANGCCIREFTSTFKGDEYEAVVVAEPTQCQAITSHRGYLSVIGRFHGEAGHSSEARALTDNAIHAAANWAAEAVAIAGSYEGDERSCFNIGRIEGGIKSNVIADSAEVRWSARLPAGRSNDEFFDRITAPANTMAVDWERPFSGPPLPAGGRDADAAHDFIRRCVLDSGGAVDFWTEASLFCDAGLPAIVLGPGNIEQAHIIDEWVAIEQLEQVERIYRDLIERHG
ncbi:MAG: acetylornithine deacetylase [Pseudomonadota bacterium]